MESDKEKKYKTMIQDMLSFAIPDELTEMTAEESAAFFPRANEECYGLRNKDRHTIIAVICKKRPLLIGRAASLEDSLKATEKKVMKDLPSYENLGYGSKTVDGKEIPTFEFRYTAQGKNQTGKYGLCFAGRYFLAFQYICGEEYASFAEKKFDEFLSGVKFR